MPTEVIQASGLIRFRCDVCQTSYSQLANALLCEELDRRDNMAIPVVEEATIDVDFSE